MPGKHGREEMQMKKIIFDCDNTFGVKDCDVDDGLALMYLLGSREAQLLGITSTYGNSSLDVVQAANLRMLEELGRRDIPVKRGGRRGAVTRARAAVFLQPEMADRHPGKLSILATGSLTNLKGAYERDSHFFEKVKEIVLMGGITSPLVFEKKVMDELNFSCDPPAARTVLTKGRNISVITGNNCLKVLFTKQEYRERFSEKENRAAAYIMEKTDDWFRYNDEGYGIHGFYNWDVTAAAYLMHPELFADNVKCLCVSEQDLETGYLRMGEGWDERGMESRNESRNQNRDERCYERYYERWNGVPDSRREVYMQSAGHQGWGGV
ncbi:MAG: nucleoside hydrolase [Enterocloster bolteae]